MKFLVFFLCLLNVWGDETNEQRLKYLLESAQNADPAQVPGYEGVNVPQANLNYQTIDKAAPDDSTQEVVDFVNNTFENRPKFNIDPETDPIMVNSQNALKMGDHLENSTQFQTKQTDQYELVSCEEIRDHGTFDCYETLMNVSIAIDPAKSSHWWCTTGDHSPDDPHCQAKKYYETPKVYKPESVSVINLEWGGSCEGFKTKEQTGFCRLKTRKCTQNAEKRYVEGLLNGKLVKREIKQDCWQYKNTYECGSPSTAVNNCASFREKGYEQVESSCSKKLGKVCVAWKQVFKKPISYTQETTTIQFDDESLVPTRDKKLASPDGDFAQVASTLSIFGEMQKDIKTFKSEGDFAAPKIFKGDRRVCRKNGFMNCCSSEKGKRVAVATDLVKCEAEEKDLANKNQKGQCYYVGEYCARRIPLTGICSLWKQSYCCFPSKLSKIVHVQGRPQISMDWGSPEHPRCDGFNLETIQKIDFSKLNLSEYFEDIQARTNLKAPEAVAKQLSNRFESMESNDKNTREGGH